MSPQIESLRKQYQGMNTAQKKQFIDNLKQKLAGKNNAEYNKFLAECIQDYNTNTTDNSGSSSGATKNVSVAQTQVGNTVSANSQLKKCGKCGAMIDSFQNRCPNCLTVYKSSFASSTNPIKSALIIGAIGNIIFIVITFLYSILGFFTVGSYLINILLPTGLMVIIVLFASISNIESRIKRVIILIGGFCINFFPIWHIVSIFIHPLPGILIFHLIPPLIILGTIISIALVALKKTQ